MAARLGDVLYLAALGIAIFVGLGGSILLVLRGEAAAAIPVLAIGVVIALVERAAPQARSSGRAPGSVMERDLTLAASPNIIRHSRKPPRRGTATEAA
jgi:hypothetical protein